MTGVNEINEMVDSGAISVKVGESLIAQLNQGTAVIVVGHTGSGKKVLMECLVDSSKDKAAVVSVADQQSTIENTLGMLLKSEFNMYTINNDLGLYINTKPVFRNEQEAEQKTTEAQGEANKLLNTAIMHKAGNHWFEAKDTRD